MINFKFTYSDFSEEMSFPDWKTAEEYVLNLKDLIKVMEVNIESSDNNRPAFRSEE